MQWDGRTAGAWSAELEGSAVVNLAGELVDRRPTAANVDVLTRSRVEPTRALVEASAGLDEVCRSSIRLRPPRSECMRDRRRIAGAAEFSP